MKVTLQIPEILVIGGVSGLMIGTLYASGVGLIVIGMALRFISWTLELASEKDEEGEK